MNYAVMHDFVLDKNSGQYKAPFNTVFNEAMVFTSKDTTVITPNSDTPYSMLWLDLPAEPLVSSVPAVEEVRLYSVMLCDGNTFNYGCIGSRATGNGAGDHLAAGPDWTGQGPPGIKKVSRSSTQFPLVIFRTQPFNAKDMPNVVKIQAGYKARPLAAHLKNAPPPPPAVDFPKIYKELVKKNFFEYPYFALQSAPPGPEGKEIREKLARIGIGPVKSFDFKGLTLEHKVEIGLGMKEGEKKVEEKVASVGNEISGWRVASSFGDRAFFNGDWLLRAAAAKAGICRNDAGEAMYPMTRWLANGEVLEGGKKNYVITFPAGQYPPVNAFWSMTMYDGKTVLPIKNPIDRYRINSPMLPGMKKNADGSLTIYVQKDSRGKGKEANRLQAPDDPIYMAMRLCWPKTVPPSILPPGQGSWQPAPVKKVQYNGFNSWKGGP